MLLGAFIPSMLSLLFIDHQYKLNTYVKITGIRMCVFKSIAFLPEQL